MITASKNTVPDVSVATSEIQKAKDALKKVSSTSSCDDKKLVQEQKGVEHTLALISCNDNLNDIISHIKNNGFTVINTKTIQLSLDQAKELYVDHQTQSYYDKMVNWLSSGSNICALILEKQDAIKDWKHLMGPANYKKARKASPNSIRALFGKDASQNATHGSDSDASAEKEIDFIFGDTVPSIQENPIPTSGVAMETPQQQQEQEQKQDQQQQQSKHLNSMDGVITKREPEAPAAPNNESSANLHNDSSSAANTNKNVDTIAQVLTEDASDNEKNIAPLNDRKTEHDNNEAPNPQSVSPVDKEETIDKSATPTEATSEEEVISNNSEAPKDNIANRSIDNDISVKSTPPSDEAIHDTAKDVIQNEATPKMRDDELSEETTASPVEEKETENNTTQKEEEAIISVPVMEKKLVNDSNKVNTELEVQEQSNTVTLPAQEVSPEKVAEYEATQEQEKSIPLSPKGVEDVIDDVKKDDTNKQETSTNTTTDNESEESGASASDTTIVNKVEEKSSLSKLDARSKKKDGIAKKTPIPPKKKANAEKVKSDAVKSNSRIRPPSTAKGKNDKPAKNADSSTFGRASSQAKVISSKKSNTATNGGATGTTRIARLSPSATMNSRNSPTSSASDKKNISIATATKKAATTTKVSKNLPRVATISSQKQQAPPKEEENDKEKEAKKRVSSTKSFISRLTAPTVASANKKTDNEVATPTIGGISRRATLPSKRAATVKPSKSNSTSLVSKNSQASTKHKKGESAAVNNSKIQQIKSNEIIASDAPEHSNSEKFGDDEKISD